MDNNFGVLVSIRPNWVEQILAGVKTIEIRKRWPGLALPYKVYIYCTLGGQEKWLAGIKDGRKAVKLNGKICGEFTCDRIEVLLPDDYDRWLGRVCQDGCIAPDRLMAYAGGKTLYAWHISDVQVYDRPMMLEEFRYAWCTDPVKNAPQGLVYVACPAKSCRDCAFREGNHCLRLHCYLGTDLKVYGCEYWTRQLTKEELYDRGTERTAVQETAEESL